jgi:hypothetical protein
MLVQIAAGRADSFYVNYSKHIDPWCLPAFNTCILSPHSDLDPSQVRRVPGQQFLGYVSVVEVAHDAPYRAQVLEQGLPSLATNSIWRSLVMDISDPAWQAFVITNLARQVRQRGFDGFFLDTADSIEWLRKRQPERAQYFRDGLVRLVRELKRQFPDCPIVINRGYEVWPSVRDVVDGVLFESLFQTYDFERQVYATVPEPITRTLLEQARQVRADGRRVLVLDYVDPKTPAVAEAAARRIEAEGWEALVSTPALEGTVLAPLQEVPRRVIILYGNNDPDIEQAIRWPADSATAQSLQMPLQWLGYEPVYVNGVHDPLPASAQGCAGVILDRFLEVPAEREALVADWLLRWFEAGRKIIFVGELHFAQSAQLERVMQALGLRGSGRPVTGLEAVQPMVVSPRAEFEAKLVVRTDQFIHLEAPAGSESLLALSGRKPGETAALRFDPVFIAPWGGALLDPYALFMNAEFDAFWIIDPFYFLAGALGKPDWPTPDITTRDGVRLFFTHVDGDGFWHPSLVEKGKRSVQVVVDRLVKRYPYPFALSVVEAEIRALGVGHKAEDEPLLVELAREMFALPNVEAASHTFSHPFFWVPEDRTSVLYEAAALDLQPVNGQKYEFDLRREIEGSVDYIQQHLLPPGKRVRLFLWSGNCRPPEAALRLTRELGLENLNGGNTLTSRKHPSLAGVAPPSLPQGEELQIHCGYQNEAYYWLRKPTHATLPLPFYGGLLHAQDGFEMLDSPRRLKPVNIYFHFYSGDNLSALRAVERLFQWATRQELHAVYASEYARMVRDSRATRLYRRSPEEWILVNAGHQRTFRFDQGQLRPDLAQSSGVIGWREDRDSIYVHTDGSPRVRLVRRADPAPHLFLERSTAPIRFLTLGPVDARFQVQDLRPGSVILGGLPPQAAVTVNLNGSQRQLTADGRGRLSLEVPQQAEVAVQLRSSP